jgi:hypothetical protein
MPRALTTMRSSTSKSVVVAPGGSLYCNAVSPLPYIIAWLGCHAAHVSQMEHSISECGVGRMYGWIDGWIGMGFVWGGQSTPGWKWRRIVYQQNQNPTTTLVPEILQLSPILCVIIAFDLAVRLRLLSNRQSFLSSGTITRSE